jgi:hypothetical protein
MSDNLYIKVIDGSPVDHPLLETNLLHIYDELENIPDHYEPFVRVGQNVNPGLYQKVVFTYEKIDGVWQDVWTVVDMTDDEKSVRESELKDWFDKTKEDLLNKLKYTIQNPKSLLHISSILVFTEYKTLIESLQFDPNVLEFPAFPRYDYENEVWVSSQR